MDCCKRSLWLFVSLLSRRGALELARCHSRSQANSEIHSGPGDRCSLAAGLRLQPPCTQPLFAGGALHSLAVKSDGTVWAWGANGNGQLGDGSTSERRTPTQVAGLSGVTGVGRRGSHSLAVKSDGTLWAWGANSDGQLGDGTVVDRSLPVQVSGLTGVVAGSRRRPPLGGAQERWTVWTWGFAQYGQLGGGTTPYTPTKLARMVGLTGVVAVAAGGLHTLALKSDGTVWAWGYNAAGGWATGATTTRALRSR